LGEIPGSNGQGCSTIVNVMLFNCEEVKDIVSVVDREIKEVNNSLVEYPDKKILLTELEFFSNLKKDIEDLALRHDVPKELINFLSSLGIRGLSKEEVIFLSGISSFVEE
jgi:hypothetical protein